MCVRLTSREREREKGLLAMSVASLCQCEEKHVFCVPVKEEEMVTHTHSFLPSFLPPSPTSILACLVWWWCCCCSWCCAVLSSLFFSFFQTSWSVRPKGRKHVHLGQDFFLSFSSLVPRGPEPQFLSIAIRSLHTHTHSLLSSFFCPSFFYVLVCVCVGCGVKRNVRSFALLLLFRLSVLLLFYQIWSGQKTLTGGGALPPLPLLLCVCLLNEEKKERNTQKIF